MRIAILGSGGVGGYFGARLAAAGEDVHFVARGDHLKAIRNNGLRVTSALGDVHIEPAQATDDPASIGIANFVFVTVKLYDMAAAIEGCRSVAGPQTTIVSFQNGVVAIDMLTAALGPERIIGGASYILSMIEAPGVIAHLGPFARLLFGEIDGTRTGRINALKAACDGAGIDNEVSDDIVADIWAKFAILAPLSGMTALTRADLGAIRGDPDTAAMLHAATAEVIAAGRAAGVAMPKDAPETAMAGLDAMPDDMSSSLRHDLEHGRRLELEWLSGTVSRLGREHGVATPTHDVICTALKLHADGRAA